MSAGFSRHTMAPADLARSADRAPPHLAPILRAAAQGVVAFGHVTQHAGPFRLPQTRPVVLIVGDDYDLSYGPQAFHTKSLKRFLRRAGTAVVVSGAAEPAPYAAAVAGAVLLGRDVAIIETREAHEAAWIALIQAAHPRIPTLISTPGRCGEAVH